MLREERLRLILSRLQNQGRVASVALSEELRVSDDTIRRDLNELAASGLLRKVHGGAIPSVPKAPAPLKLSERVLYAQAEKEEIARKAVKLFKDGQSVILDNGSTNMLIARNLPPALQATVFTNSIPIAQILSEHPSVDVILLGGRVFKRAQVAVGAAVASALDELRPDLCILGVCSIHPDVGLTTPDWEEAQIKQKMVQVTQKLVVTAWRDKLNTAETCRVCNCDELDLLVVESSIDAEKLDVYRRLGVEVW
jgi:DeoR/GlpR family transcriptional regulator of sugar metabolism